MGRHLFVCYAHEDEDFVLKLSSNLRTRGTRVWVDRQDILPGADWDRSIEQAIKECARFLIVLSPSLEASEEARGELRMALEKNKPIIPVLHQPCEIPRRLLTIHYVDFRSTSPDDDRALAMLLQAVGAGATADSDAPVSPAPNPLARFNFEPLPRVTRDSTQPPLTTPASHATYLTDRSRIGDLGSLLNPSIPNARQLLVKLGWQISGAEMVVCPWCGKHVACGSLPGHCDEKHDGQRVDLPERLRTVSEGPTPDERQQIEAEAHGADQERMAFCPACQGDVKRKNLLAHWNRHWEKRRV